MFTGPLFLGLYIAQISSTLNAVIISTAMFLVEVAWQLFSATVTKK